MSKDKHHHHDEEHEHGDLDILSLLARVLGGNLPDFEDNLDKHEPKVTKREFDFGMNNEDGDAVLHFIGDPRMEKLAEETVDHAVKLVRKLHLGDETAPDKLICGGCAASLLINIAMVFVHKGHLTIREARGFYAELAKILSDKSRSADFYTRRGHGDHKLALSEMKRGLEKITA